MKETRETLLAKILALREATITNRNIAVGSSEWRAVVVQCMKWRKAIRALARKPVATKRIAKSRFRLSASFAHVEHNLEQTGL